MNVVPVKVANNRYILAIFDKDGYELGTSESRSSLVKIILRTYDDCPLVVKGYTEALRVAKTSSDGYLVHLTEAMPRSEYDARLAKYKAKLALINSTIVN